MIDYLEPFRSLPTIQKFISIKVKDGEEIAIFDARALPNKKCYLVHCYIPVDAQNTLTIRHGYNIADIFENEEEMWPKLTNDYRVDFNKTITPIGFLEDQELGMLIFDTADVCFITFTDRLNAHKPEEEAHDTTDGEDKSQSNSGPDY